MRNVIGKNLKCISKLLIFLLKTLRRLRKENNRYTVKYHANDIDSCKNIPKQNTYLQYNLLNLKRA